jgi:hypothetical protein
MNEIKVRLLADDVNAVVLITPGRNFPGMVIQGDSLRGLHRVAERVRQLAHGLQNGELLGEIHELCERLEERVVLYESVLDRHGISLPYPDRVGGK